VECPFIFEMLSMTPPVLLLCSAHLANLESRTYP
jgi:hypothetical protein